MLSSIRLYAGASFTGSISLAGLKERGHVLKEQEIMTGIHKELKFIADRYELLKLGPYHGMDDYRKNTLQFVEAELKKLAPSGLRGTLEYMGFASSQNKEKIEMLLELKKMLEPTGVLGKEIDGFKYFADNSPVMDIKQSVDKAKYEVAKIEGTLIAMGIESPHAKQIKAAEKELKDSSTAIEKSYSSMDKKDDKVSSSKFFSSKDLPQKGQALLAAQFKVDSLKQIYNPDKFYTPTQGITR